MGLDLSAPTSIVDVMKSVAKRSGTKTSQDLDDVAPNDESEGNKSESINQETQLSMMYFRCYLQKTL